MRSIDMIIVHCSATRRGMDFHSADIDRWHRERGFSKIGYHYVITLDGTVEPGRDESEAGAHCSGYNSRSIGICYVGGLDCNGNPADTRTDRQRESLRRLIGELTKRYPGVAIHGHCEFAAKACPCFDVRNDL